MVLETTVGYVLMGSLQANNSSSPCISLLSVTPSLDILVQQFWELVENSLMAATNKEDILADEHFASTHYQDPSGRYVVSLPFRDSDDFSALSNRTVVHTILLNLERRLKKNQASYQAYDKFFQEYLPLGHMELSIQASKYLLSHRLIYKTTSNCTKVRVIFNGSAMTKSGKSLNDFLLFEALNDVWGSFTSQIKCLSSIKILRFIGLVENATLIGFSDASECGYVTNLNEFQLPCGTGQNKGCSLKSIKHTSFEIVRNSAPCSIIFII